MHLLPFDDLLLRSPEPPERLARRLDGLITRGRRVPGAPTPFCGVFDGHTFQIVQVASNFGRNSFRPVITGHVFSAPGGSEIRARLQLQTPVLAFMLVWFGSPASMVVGLVVQDASAVFGLSEASPPMRDALVVLAISLGFLLVGWLIMSLPFWSDVRRARLALAEGLQASLGRENDAHQPRQAMPPPLPGRG